MQALQSWYQSRLFGTPMLSLLLLLPDFAHEQKIDLVADFQAMTCLRCKT